MDIPPWVLQSLASLIGGGLAGASLTIVYNLIKTKIEQDSKGKGVLSALAGEARRCKILCEYNGRMDIGGNPNFISFPITVALSATFEERHAFPKLQAMMKDLEAYTLALLHINQMIELHNSMWPALDKEFSGTHKNNLRNQVIGWCKGEKPLEGVGPDNYVVLPNFISQISAKLDERVIGPSKEKRR